MHIVSPLLASAAAAQMLDLAAVIRMVESVAKTAASNDVLPQFVSSDPVPVPAPQPQFVASNPDVVVQFVPVHKTTVLSSVVSSQVQTTSTFFAVSVTPLTVTSAETTTVPSTTTTTTTMSIEALLTTASASDVAIPITTTTTTTTTIEASPTTIEASPIPTKPQGSNPNDPFDISNTLFDGTCAFYINTVKANLANSVPSGNINNGGVTSFRQYDCTINDFTRCPAGPGTWGGDADWVWNKAISSNTDPYRYNVIWFMQLIGDSDDLFHECEDDPRAFDVSRFATTPLNLKPDCITFGKWCRTWAGHVAQGKTITVQGAEYSVEAAFLKLSSNRIKIDFKDETIYKSYLRSGMTLDEQVAIAEQFREDGTGNCITDQHFCYECNNYPGHCTAGEGCLRYKDVDGSMYCP